MKKITFLIPCYNEEATLPRLFDELQKFTVGSYSVTVRDDGAGQSEAATFETVVNAADYEWEFLMVDDGSSDATLRLLRQYREADPRVSVLSLSRNFGKENAMLAGMDYFTGDALVILDADLQNPLRTVPEMIYWWERGYDDIYGRRQARWRESRLRKTLSTQFHKFMKRTGSVEILQDVGDFRLLDRRAVRALTSMRESQRYTKGLFCWIGYKKRAVDFSVDDRVGGKSSFNLRSLVNLAVEGIVSYSSLPLRISTLAGLMVSVVAFVYLIFIIVKTIVWGEPVAGFPTLMCAILFLGGMQLLALGIIGEYIGRIFNESKRRPPYIVDSYNGVKAEIHEKK